MDYEGEAKVNSQRVANPLALRSIRINLQPCEIVRAFRLATRHKYGTGDVARTGRRSEMPALKKTDESKMYCKTSSEARLLGDANFCIPLAVSLVTDVPYAEVNKLMLEMGRKFGKGTYCHVTEKVLDALGFKQERVDIGEVIARFPKPHCNALKNLTTHHPRRFPGCLDPNKRYLAYTQGHALAITGGEVHDWSVNRSLRIYRLETVELK